MASVSAPYFFRNGPAAASAPAALPANRCPRSAPERNMEIERENRLLLEKMSMIVSVQTAAARPASRNRAYQCRCVQPWRILADGERPARDGVGQHDGVCAGHSD